MSQNFFPSTNKHQHRLCCLIEDLNEKEKEIEKVRHNLQTCEDYKLMCEYIFWLESLTTTGDSICYPYSYSNNKTQSNYIFMQKLVSCCQGVNLLPICDFVASQNYTNKIHCKTTNIHNQFMLLFCIFPLYIEDIFYSLLL